MAEDRSNEASRAAEPKASWTAPMVVRLHAGQAEAGDGNGPDNLGFIS